MITDKYEFLYGFQLAIVDLHYDLKKYDLKKYECNELFERLTILSYKFFYTMVDFYSLSQKTSDLISNDYKNKNSFFSELGNRIKSDIKNNDEETNQIISSNYLTQQKLTYEFLFFQETVLNFGVAIKIYSFFENILEILCDLYEKYFNIKIDNEDSKSKISKYVEYLEKNFNVKLTKTNEWYLLISWNKIRNRFMHGYGILKKNESDLKKRVEMIGLDIVEKPYIYDIEQYICIKPINIKELIMLIDVILSKCIVDIEVLKKLGI